MNYHELMPPIQSSTQVRAIADGTEINHNGFVYEATVSVSNVRSLLRQVWNNEIPYCKIPLGKNEVLYCYSGQSAYPPRQKAVEQFLIMETERG
jgi:hypothetical protein